VQSEFFIFGSMRRVSFLTAFFLFAYSIFAQGLSSRSSEKIIVLPFENKSTINNKAEFNWVGEAIAKSLADILANSREAKAIVEVVSDEERKLLQNQLGISSTSVLSLATSLKLARLADATVLVVGEYNVFPAQGDAAATISVKSRLVRVKEGRFIEDGERGFFKPIDLSEALTKLQDLQGKLAYQILLRTYTQPLPFAEKDFIKASNKIPPKAFEAYIKGLLSTSDPGLREAFLKNAIRIYDQEKSEKEEVIDEARVYSEAILELGYFYLNQGKFDEAVEYLSRIPENDQYYEEAALYIGSIYWRQKSYERALAVLRSVAKNFQLVDVFNMIGVVAVEASQDEKKDKRKSAALLEEGLKFLKAAVESTPESNQARFNYGFALFLNQDYVSAVENLTQIIQSNPSDGEAYYIIAKALEQLEDKQRSADFDNQARRFLKRYAELESSWRKDKTFQIQLRFKLPSREEINAMILAEKSKKLSKFEKRFVTETERLLDQAKNFYKDGSDEKAMNLLRKILAIEPMMADAYFLIGQIYLRQGEMEQAVANLKTALFWNNQLIDAYISLAKIFIEKGDCLQAKNQLEAAKEVNPENEEVIALQRQIERCAR
jgi:tetratricopeptide (TPR) repeat protein